MKFWRTMRHLSPVQVAHRVRLRVRLALRLRLGEPPLPRSHPALRGLPMLPVEFYRPCALESIHRHAERLAEGRFEFLGQSLPEGEPLFPAPDCVPLLFAYHLEYMDYLLDLAVSGRTDVVERLVRQRLAAAPSHHFAALHPYPVSRRCAAFLRILPLVDGDLRSLLARAAFGMARRIRRNLELDVGGNHLLENGLALALAGSTFRGREAGSLQSEGARILLSGAREQVLVDGAHYELSPAYHARVLEVLLEGGLALSHAGMRLPSEYWQTLSRMQEWLHGTLDPEGELPLLGDCWRTESFRPGRFLAAVRDVLPGAVPPVAEGDRLSTGSGLVNLQDRREGHRLLLDAGTVCPERLPAHGHADTFSYELHLSGRPVVVDAGLFEYAAGEMRDYCRSTRAHSTVEVDGTNSSEVWSSFRIGRRARVHDLAFSLESGLGTVTARHDGYRHLGVEHRRKVRHLAPGAFLIADTVRGKASAVARSRIHLHPECVLERLSGGGLLIHCRGVTATISHVVAGEMTVEQGWHCPDFGRRRRTQVLVLRASGCESVIAYLIAVGSHPEMSLRRNGQLLRGRLHGQEFSERIP